MPKPKAERYRFKLGMSIHELRMPLEDALALAKDLGMEYVRFNRLQWEPEIADLTDEEIDNLGNRIARFGLKLHSISPGAPFKEIHLSNLNLETLQDDPSFREAFCDLVKAMKIARRLGVRAVEAFTFAWPGEYSAGKPTWPMRWQTRGGIISEVDLEKLAKAFSLVLEQAEHYDLDIVLSQMAWNYTNTTTNFKVLAERLGSQRIKVRWGPADNLNCGEWDVSTAGFRNVLPYLHSLHIKDLHVTDGIRCKFDYRAIGEGDVDYLTILRNLRNERCDALLAVATHFLPPGGSAEDAMRINVSNLKSLIAQAEKSE